MADQMSAPNGMHIDAAGRVTYDFEGHVKATGLDLTAGDGTSVPTDQVIEWLRASDGDAVAKAYAFYAGAGEAGAGTDRSAYFAAVATPRGAHESSAGLFATDETTDDYTGLSVVHDRAPDLPGGPTTSGVVVGLWQNLLPVLTRWLVRDDGSSDFIQQEEATRFLQLSIADDLRAQFFQTPDVESDPGGWCDFDYPQAFAAVPFAVWVMTDADSGSFGFPALVVERTSALHCRVFINAPAEFCTFNVLAIGTP